MKSASRVLGCLLILATLLVLPNAASSIEAQRFRVLHTFTGGTDGGSPVGGLIRDARGNLYGTAGNVVFRLDKTGNETVLYRGISSMGSLIQDAAGNLYGTTYAGGHNNFGTVFELDTNGNATVLHSFRGGTDGKYPAAGVVMDRAGNLYGTTSQGGVHDRGIVFKLTTSRREIVLHSFAGPDGSTPLASLMRDGFGNLYGTTEFGGYSNQCAGVTNGCGVVFKLDRLGRETVLYAFTGGVDGSRPVAGLIRDPQGNFYGTTVAGGTAGFGTVFQLDGTNKETVLHSFTGPDGVEPSSSLVRDNLGNLYGTTLDAGQSDTGTLFEIDAARNFSVLHYFDGAKDGYFLPAGLVRDPHGNLYGVTELGGRFGYGTVYKLTP